MKVDQRERTVVQKYNVYISKDEKEFNSEDECINHEKILDGTRIVCPSCNGEGVQRDWIEPHDHWDGPMGGYYASHKCQRCGGKGYLDKKITWE